MRTTLKRGIGRSAADADGRPELPPSPVGPTTVYRQPPPPRRSRTRLALHALGWAAVALVTVAAGIAGGAYLYVHETVAAVAPKSEAVKRAARRLDIALPGQPATALVVGYDKRKGADSAVPPRSDTLMLMRADPGRKAISLLSFPRDMIVDVRCPGKPSYRGRINEAFTRCGFEGSLTTVRALTGVPINYVVTVNFRGFRQIVDKLGGVWLDIDRRYFNDRGGPTGYATINLHPGYQRVNGTQALDFVRFRHTDSDLHRVVRQQQFIKSFRDQLTSSISLTTLPKVIKTITNNVEVGQGGGKDVSAKTVLSYALLAYSLPPGHVFQSKIEGLEGYAELTTDPANVTRAVQQFLNPDVESPTKATNVVLGVKPKVKVPPVRDTTVTVLNGNGVTGSATNASYLLGQRGYKILTPPNGIPANAPSFDYFRTTVFFDPRKPGARLAAQKVANLFGAAETEPLRQTIRGLSNDAMVVTVVGQTFHGRLAPSPVDQTPTRQPAQVVRGGDASEALLRQLDKKVGFPLMRPTVVESRSGLHDDEPVRLYGIDPDKKHKAVRLVYDTGANEYWGIQMTDWKDAAALKGRSFTRRIGGRRYELHYNGPKLHMVVLRTNKGTYWVVNTLLDSLSNETMLAIAKGLRPLAKARGAS